MSLYAAEGKVFVGGYTCPGGCTAGDDSPSSDFALTRLSLTNGDVDTGFDTDGMRDFSIGHTDVGYSIALQDQAGSFPNLVIGGYSATNDGDTPFMSGGRVAFDGSGTPSIFRSTFGGVRTRGDQAWEVQVQENDRIVAGGFHTRGVQNGGPTFATIRLCKNPTEDPCDASGMPSGGGNENTPGEPYSMYVSMPPRFKTQPPVTAPPEYGAATPEVMDPSFELGGSIDTKVAPAQHVQRRMRDDGEDEFVIDPSAWPT
jgi:hypothetical protein